MTEWGKAMRPTVHDLVEQTNTIDEKVDNIETLPIIVIDYDTANDPITATVNKTYAELSTYTDCIVHDFYIGDVTLGTVSVIDDAVQIVYGFSGIVSEEITYNTMTVTVESDNSTEIVIETDTFEINYDYVVGSATYKVNSNLWTNVQINNEIFNKALLLNGNEFNPYVFLVNTAATDRYSILYLQGKTTTNNLKFFGFYDSTVALNIEISTSAITTKNKQNFRLTPATTTQLGGVIIGNEFTVNGNGKFSLKTASATQLGGVKVGDGLSIDSDGVLSASGGGLQTLVINSYETDDTVTYNLVNTTYNEILQNMTNLIPVVHYYYNNVFEASEICIAIRPNTINNKISVVKPSEVLEIYPDNTVTSSGSA